LDPGNGKSIRIWDNPILGDPPLNQNEEMDNIREWLQNRNLLTLWDISIWGTDDERSWESWDLGGYPENLEVEASKLIELLQGKSPLKILAKDKRGWGFTSSKYSAAEGYHSLRAIPFAPPDPSQWKSLWTFTSIPKIDFFS